MSSSSLKLTKVERLLLANQLRILEILDPEKSNKAHRKAIERGYSAHYADAFHALDGDEVSAADSEFVRSVLDMHRALMSSNDKLPKAERRKSREVRIRGFDGNGEAALLAYARYLVKDLGLYEEQDEVPNSHTPTRQRYATMLGEWTRSRDKNELAGVDIARILGET